MAAKTKQVNPNPAPEPAPDLELTPEQVEALEQEKKVLLQSLGYVPPAPAAQAKAVEYKSKKKGVITPTTPEPESQTLESVQSVEPPPPVYETTIPGTVSAIDKKLLEIQEQADAAKAAAIAEHQAALLAQKKATLAHANKPAQPGSLADLTSRIDVKIHTATVAIAEQEKEKFLKGCTSTLEPADKLAAITLEDLDKYDLAPWGALLGWDPARLQRMKLLTVNQASRLGAVQDILRNVGQFRKQLLDVRQDIRDFPKQYGTHARPIALMRVKELVAVVEGSASAPFHLRNALRDAAKLLGELENSTLKPDPSMVELKPSHAALAGMAQPKVIVQDKAITDFSPISGKEA